jgi:hypothetical protein
MTSVLDLEFALPRYLSDEQNDSMLKELREYPKMDNIYNSFPQQNWLQGDIYKGIMYCDLMDGEYRIDKIEAMLLSNTCDISLENRRDFYEPKFVFAPVIDLNKYYENLLDLIWCLVYIYRI